MHFGAPGSTHYPPYLWLENTSRSQNLKRSRPPHSIPGALFMGFSLKRSFWCGHNHAQGHWVSPVCTKKNTPYVLCHNCFHNKCRIDQKSFCSNIFVSKICNLNDRFTRWWETKKLCVKGHTFRWPSDCIRLIYDCFYNHWTLHKMLRHIDTFDCTHWKHTNENYSIYTMENWHYNDTGSFF